MLRIDQPIQVKCGPITLEGHLSVPDGAMGLVVFAHGSGSSRHSPRNLRVARMLQSSGLATMLMDLLTPDEEGVDIQTARLRFNIPLLAQRLICAADWLGGQTALERLPLGLFGSSTGAAAALVAAADRPQAVRAIVSRGGRPDLAGEALRRVRTPTLFIVGGNDTQVIALNEAAMKQLPGETSLVIARAHRTSSKSLERSTRLRAWPPSGSLAISPVPHLIGSLLRPSQKYVEYALRTRKHGALRSATLQSPSHG